MYAVDLNTAVADNTAQVQQTDPAAGYPDLKHLGKTGREGKPTGPGSLGDRCSMAGACLLETELLFVTLFVECLNFALHIAKKFFLMYFYEKKEKSICP